MPSRLETKEFVQQEYKWKKNEKKMRGRELDVAENCLVTNNIVHENLQYGKRHKKIPCTEYKKMHSVKVIDNC
jgi:hypothetical protein